MSKRPAATAPTWPRWARMVQLVTRGILLDTMRVDSSDEEIEIRVRLPDEDRVLSHARHAERAHRGRAGAAVQLHHPQAGAEAGADRPRRPAAVLRREGRRGDGPIQGDRAGRRRRRDRAGGGPGPGPGRRARQHADPQRRRRPLRAGRAGRRRKHRRGATGARRRCAAGADQRQRAHRRAHRHGSTPSPSRRASPGNGPATRKSRPKARPSCKAPSWARWG